MRYKYIFFDLDGTLINSAQAVVATINDTLQYHGFPQLEEGSKGFFGRRVYSGLADKIDPAILIATHIKLQERHFYKNKPYPQAREVLQSLQNAGCIMVVLTSANNAKVKHLIRELGFESFFRFVITEADVKNRKPHPEPFEMAFKKLGLTEKDKSLTLMVGDEGGSDIVGAQAFGIDSVGVTFSSFEASIKEYNPTYTIDSLIELLPIVGVHND